MVENTQIQRQIHFARCHIHLNTKCKNLVLKEKFGCSKKIWMLNEKFGCSKEKFGINCASAEAQFGTRRGIIIQIGQYRRPIVKQGDLRRKPLIAIGGYSYITLSQKGVGVCVWGGKTEEPKGTTLIDNVHVTIIYTFHRFCRG